MMTIRGSLLMSTGENDIDSPVSTFDENESLPVETEPGDEAKPAMLKLDLDVQINNVGPCKKHLTVTIPRSDIERQFDESLGTMKREAIVPGFRPGHAPRTLVERRFRKQVGEQVKQTLMMAALEQLDTDFKLNPIAQPKLDLNAIKIPDEGPLRFEMELEVQPEFKLPAYKALTVNRPVKTISEDDVDSQLKLFLERHAQTIPKLEGGAEIGDFLTADLRFEHQGQTLNEVKEIQFRLQQELRFQDGSVPRIGEVLTGIRPGEERSTEAKIGSGSADPNLRGLTIQVHFKVHDLKTYRLPEVNTAFLSRLGFESLDELREALREILERRLKSQQRQAIRREIMDRMIQETSFDLPKDLLARQEKSTLSRMVMEMKQEGLNESEIRAREAQIRANAAESTQRGLTEFFIMAKIAEAEEIKVEDEDFVHEIEAIAARTDESPRRVRARLEKEGMGDSLAAQILERKTLDRILEYVKFEEVPLVEQDVAVETLDHTATNAPPEEESVPEEAAAEGAASEAVAEGATSAEAAAPGASVEGTNAESDSAG